MADDAVIRAKAANRDVADEKCGPFQDCRDVVRLTVFFDGTGNNEKFDGTFEGVKLDKWSNVGRLYYAMLQHSSKDIFPIYVAGVGTPFNGKAESWIDSAEIWTEDGKRGEGFGAGGSRRLELGDQLVSDALAAQLIRNAKTLGGETEKYAKAGTERGLADINAVLAKYRLVKVIDMSFFGFSRGAALARAFSNRVIANCQQSDDGLKFHGYPVRQSFLGIFDTVASFGVPSKNVRLPFEERELIVSPLVERCVHYVAAHEVRVAFPVDLIRKNGRLAGEWVEDVYPGVHSDVGGGYGPKDQGIDNNYARIPMRNMMREAIASGVRLLPYEEIKKESRIIFKERFECLDSTQVSYGNYMAACGPMSSPVETQIKRHLQLFYSANGTMARRGIETAGDRRRNEDPYKKIGPKGMAWEVKKYRLAAKVGGWLRFAGKGVRGYAQYVKPQDWQLNAWDKPASNEVVNFVAHYIHDSKVDFIFNLIEPFSYFKPRGIDESTTNVWTEWGTWMGGKRDTVTKAVGDTYEAGKKEVGEAVDTTTKAATDAAIAAKQKAEEAAAYAQRKAAEAAKYASQKADEAAAATKHAYDATAKAANEAAAAAQQKAHEAALFAQRKAQAAADAVEGAYDATTKAASEAAAAGAKRIDDIEDGAERLYDRGINWIKRTAKGR
jgi:hypothetical protein